jgi:S-adenosylmethionine:tRNA ribosyltransferase-isomerase
VTGGLAFDLPPGLAAGEPPEARGSTRDGVRMLVAERSTGAVDDTRFSTLPERLAPGDLVVVNTSATIPAAVDALTPDGTPIAVHLSTHLGGDRWVVEPRRRRAHASGPWAGAPPPARLALGEGASLALEGPYLDSPRLWVAELSLPQPVLAWLAANGRPVRYAYVERRWPLEAYQNVWATVPGSAEMPSAGRPFTAEVVTRLVARGVGVTPVVLHTGLSSPEADEPPYPERVVVPAATAQRVNATRRAGGTVLAVGTTVVRALESAVGARGEVEARDGWTDLVVTPERGVRAVDGILTGWHEPRASHLLLLEAIAGRELLERSYRAALAAGHRWHEFGDVHLVLP